jgi:hypothetical protein
MMRGKKAIAFAVVMVGALLAGGFKANAAPYLSEGFADVPGLFSNGWVQINRSEPVGTGQWVQGDPVFHNDDDPGSGFGAQAGVSNSFIVANFNSVADGQAGTISNWLLTPNLSFENGDTIRFYTRTVDAGEDENGDPVIFPDRMEVRLSQNGASSDVGTSSTDVGDFSQLLLTINPDLTEEGYPLEWTAYDLTLSGLAGPTSGRLAFRYFVTDGGGGGNNSNIIGIDTLDISHVPEPASIALGAGLLGAGCLRRRGGA